MNDIPEIFEELPLRSSTIFGLEIPLVSLRVFAFSFIDFHKGVKETKLAPRTYQKSRTGSRVLGCP